MFTKRHYQTAAREVAYFLKSEDPIEPVDVVSLFVNIFKPDNTEFDEKRFVEACGLTWASYCQE